MKEEKKDLFIIVSMCILILLILIPPLLRMMVPKQENSIVEEETPDIITTLTCTKNFASENYTVIAIITYKNNQLITNQITYNKVENLEIEKNNIQGYLPSQEISFFKSLNSINIVNNDNSISITLDEISLINNQGNEQLKNYLLDEDNEKIYYENQGYECKKETS